MKAAVVFSLAILAAPACASVQHRSILSNADDISDKGIRYYQVSPYLLVYPNGKGGVITELRYLPDLNKLMSASPEATLAGIEAELEFTHGVLTTSTETADATAASKALAKAVEVLTPKLSALFNVPEDETGATVPGPLIFKVVVDGSDVRFHGSTSSQSFKVTKLPQE